MFFVVCPVEDYRNILKWRCRPLAFTSFKAFLERRTISAVSFPASFSKWFLKKKYFSYYVLLPEQISLTGCIYFERYLVSYMCNIVIVSWWSFDVIIFWNWYYLFHQVVFSPLPKIQDKNLNTLRTKFSVETPTF